MEIKKLSNDLSVSPQVNVEDITDILKCGFKSIICNRPNDESEGQPNFYSIDEKAQELNIVTYYLPVISGAITEENKKEFEFALSKLPKPILAYCRTGNRSETLYTSVTHGSCGK